METGTYRIGEVAKMLNLAASTLRYYDAEGLLPFVERRESGVRLFSDKDLELLNVIECLKRTGMPIKDIKTFITWCQEGDSSLKERYEMFLERKAVVEKQMAELQNTLDVINYKCQYYHDAVEAGTEDIHKNCTEKAPLIKR